MYKRRGVNKWKWAFFTLLSSILLIIIVCSFIFYRLLTVEGESFIISDERELEGAEFQISTTVDDVNVWLQQQLEKDGHSNNNFHLYLEEYVHIRTEINAFGVTIPLQMEFDPHITNNGNLELVERSFMIGNYTLPAETVFVLLRNTVDLPEWIYIYPEERKFYLDLVNGISEDVQIKIDTFNLQDNNIKMRLFLS
ncbi:YpmS family protein [Evansella cellulosilytica]|uniref:DUF2140 family protein n=1 Tax=Evansella cellulosilytica (strain ATCC 21833 / DSM 2522 / FERM P-1141 / JCM 9156 / N-4) TaxID=649639 RepID=E6TUH3_EVAC2|nr:YpmS family protein [Evansella cellulosilytica]ADU29729.1 Protein of unknown function DUF2140 [Evansella cellulosilytica DSM 2522]